MVRRPKPLRLKVGLLRTLLAGRDTMKKVQLTVNAYLLGEELELSRAFTTWLREAVKTVDYMFKRVRKASIELPRVPSLVRCYRRWEPEWEVAKVWVNEILFYKEAQLEIFGE